MRYYFRNEIMFSYLIRYIQQYTNYVLMGTQQTVMKVNGSWHKSCKLQGEVRIAYFIHLFRFINLNEVKTPKSEIKIRSILQYDANLTIVTLFRLSHFSEC